MKKRKGKSHHKHGRLATRILEALSCSPVDVATLRSFAKSGFENSDLRRRVWPHLLGISDEDVDPDLPLAVADIPMHKYYDQINKDIDRSMCHFDVNKHVGQIKLARSREALHRVIHTIFVMHPDLHYFQGYHDIVGVFLIVCDFNCEQAYRLTERVSLVHIRDSHRVDLLSVIALLDLIFPLVKMVDTELSEFLESSGVQSFVTLPWLLTWFAHTMERFSDVCRVFDFLLPAHPLMIMYFCAGLFLELRSALLSLPPDFAAIHQYFQAFPDRLDLTALMDRAESLFERFPPPTMLANARLPPDSPMFLDHSRPLIELSHPLVEANRKRIRKKLHPKRRGRAGILVLGVLAVVAYMNAVSFIG